MIQYHVTTYMSMIFSITVIKNSNKLKYYLATYLIETQYAVYIYSSYKLQCYAVGLV